MSQPIDTGLKPIVLQMPEGRVGSTLLMQLLATDKRIAFDRSYPFEIRHMTLMADLCRQMPPPGTNIVDEHDFRIESIREMWKVFSEQVSRNNPEAKWYAEKLLLTSDISLFQQVLPEVYVIELVRDPRDILVSIRAFNARRGVQGFGRNRFASEDEYVRAFIEGMQQRLPTFGNNTSSILVRYEDMVENLSDEARRIGDWIGVLLDAQKVLADRAGFSHHMTSSDAASSIGRWRTELSPLDAREITSALESDLLRLGYSL